MGRGERKFFSRQVIVPLLIILVIAVIWIISSFSGGECTNWSCFNDKLHSCTETRFIGESSDMIFDYNILGLSEEGCSVNVELIQGDLKREDYVKLEGLGMVCSLPKGVIMIPESDIGNCHGLLKESIQDLIIQKLHNYIARNVGQISLESLDLPN